MCTFLCIDETDVESDSETKIWVQELNLLEEHREDIILGSAINGDVINASQQVLSKQFPEVGGMQMTYFNGSSSFRHSSRVQVHYTNEFHWVTSSTLGTPNNCCATVFDSKWNGRLSTEMEIQLAQIYGGSKSSVIHVEIAPVHQQCGQLDCGLFAIAFATDLCHGVNPAVIAYDQVKMRDHLVACLQNMYFTSFPRKEAYVRTNSRSIVPIKIFCSQLQIARKV